MQHHNSFFQHLYSPHTPASEPVNSDSFKNLVKEIKEDLYGNPAYREFFDHYNDESVCAFIDEYARRKAYYLANTRHIQNQETGRLLYFNSIARECFWEIQQKKLFLYQCRWRAGHISHPEIKTTADFSTLQYSIRNCSLVTPVTPYELEVYCEYLRSGSAREQQHGSDWQNYSLYKKEFETRGYSALPAWYVFDDELERSGVMQLPDLKGAAEKRFLDAVSNPVNAIDTGNDERQNLRFNYKNVEFFVNVFESKSVMRTFYSAEHCGLLSTAEHDWKKAVEILQLADEAVPVANSRDWRKALAEAAHRFKYRKIAEAMPQIYDEYCIRMRSGLLFDDESNRAYFEIMAKRSALYSDKIIRGRILLNEPPDFDY